MSNNDVDYDHELEKPKRRPRRFYERPSCLGAMLLALILCVGSTIIAIKLSAADICRLTAVVLNRSAAPCVDSTVISSFATQTPATPVLELTVTALSATQTALAITQLPPTWTPTVPLTPTQTITPSPQATTPITPSASHEGTIAFNSYVGNAWQAFVINPDGTNARQVTFLADGIGDPAISPDGTTILYLAEKSTQLVMTPIGQKTVTVIYQTNTEVGWPNWSPDSNMIVFGAVVDGYKQLFTAARDGSKLVQLTTDTADHIAPAFSPDGKSIAFASNRSGTWEIYVLSLGTSQATQLTHAGSANSQGWPVWSPDGTRIAFESLGVGIKGESDIFVMNSDGTGVTNVTQTPEYDGAPAWSPDGQLLAFTSMRNGNLNMFIMQADGSNVRRLSDKWGWGATWSRQ